MMRLNITLSGLTLLTFAFGVVGCTDAGQSDSEEDVANVSSSFTDAPLDALVARGGELYAEGEFANAREIWLQARDQARSAGDLIVEARVLTSLGLAAWREGDYARSQEWLESALDVELQNGLHDLLPRSYNALGLVAWDQGRFAEATELFQKTMETARAVGDLEYVEKPGMNLGLVYTGLGEFTKARSAFLTGREGGRNLGIPALEIRSLVNLAMLETRTGDPRAALQWLEQARQLDLSNDPVGEEAYWGQLVSAYIALGEPGPALAALDSALEKARAQGLRQAEAANLDLVAEIYRQAGDHQQALRLYERANALNAELGLEVEYAADLRNVAEIYAALGNAALALEKATEALTAHRALGARFAVLADELFLAELAQLRGDRDEAERKLRGARALAAEIGARTARIDAALAEARIADRLGDSRRVLRVVDDLADELRVAGFDVEWEALALRARAHARRGDLRDAAAAGRAAIAALERVRGSFASHRLRFDYGITKAAPYADLVGVLLELGDTTEAFAFADAARARPLSERLAMGRPQAVAADPPVGEELLTRISGLVEAIRSEEMNELSLKVEGLVDQLESARQEYELVRARADESNAANLRPRSGDPVVPAAIQAALQPGEAILEYLVASQRLFSFVLTSDRIRAFETAVPAEDIEGRVRLVRGLLSDPQTPRNASTAALQALHEILFSDALVSDGLQGIGRIFIVPAGALTYLPFAALHDSKRDQHLAEAFAVVYLPSAQALVAVRSRRTVPSATARLTRSGSAFAPLPEALPASPGEAERVRESFSDMQLFIGARATESKLREALASPGVVHVASHGVMNAANPLFSRIELAGTGSASSADGRLEVHEVLGLAIESPLVFLSGCETGLGAAGSTSFQNGEDYATLARAFLYAGAGNVVATLWAVEDEGSAAFATSFYRALRQAAPAEALAEAQRALLTDPGYRHGYYWAAYRLAGSGDFAAEERNNSERVR